MNADAISDFLAEQRDAAPPDLQALVLQFEDLWERKLWHQLTDALVEFFSHAGSERQRLPFYQNFITRFADKINQLKLVDLALKAAATCADDTARLSFLQDLTKRVNTPDSQDAFVYATVAVAAVQLNLKEYDAARAALDRAEKLLEGFDAVETQVHAAFYQTNADYFQHKLDFAAYYRNALLFLACIDLSALTPQQRLVRAHDLGIAALVSDDIYNFGELLQHPILKALSETPNRVWLHDLLLAFNRGDLAAFDSLSNHLTSHPLLIRHQSHIRNKIYLAALTEAVFRRPPHGRTMTFDEICAETRVRPDEIEHLVMKALSLGLVRGKIDEVARMVNFTWVQPRVLDMGQIKNMEARLGEWGEKINTLGNWIEWTGQDIWAP